MKQRHWLGAAVCLLLLLTIVLLLCSHIVRQSNNAKPAVQISNASEIAGKSDMPFGAEAANAAAQSEAESQRNPALIRIYDGDEPVSVIRFSYDCNHLMTESITETISDGEISSTQQVSMTYDDQHRLIRQDITRSDLTFLDGSGGYRIFRYNAAGKLIYEEMTSFEGWFKTTYSYDSENRLISSVEECQPYTATTTYVYDSGRNVERIEKSYDDGCGSTWSETLPGDGNEEICTDYKPFELTYYKNDPYTIRISITDKEGQAVWTTLLTAPAFQTDGRGYLTEIRDTCLGGIIRTYQICYDEEAP